MHPRILILVAVFVAAAIAVTAAGATAAGVAPWSPERLTVEVKRLKAQNARQAVKIRSLRGDVANLYYDVGFLQLYIACNVKLVPGSPAFEGEAPGDRAEACAQLVSYEANYSR